MAIMVNRIRISEEPVTKDMLSDSLFEYFKDSEFLSLCLAHENVLIPLDKSSQLCYEELVLDIIVKGNNKIDLSNHPSEFIIKKIDLTTQIIHLFTARLEDVLRQEAWDTLTFSDKTSVPTIFSGKLDELIKEGRRREG